MSQPRFLADNDFNEFIRAGVLRHEPTIHFATARVMGADRLSDPELLDLAAHSRLIVVSHDVNTMSLYAYDRIRNGLPMSGLILTAQTGSIASAINDLVTVALASEAEEYEGIVLHLPL